MGRTSTVAAFAVMVIVLSGVSPTNAEPEPAKSQDLRGASTSTPSEQWVFPALVDVFVFDPHDPPVDPDADYDQERDNRPHKIRREINDLKRDQRENGTDRSEEINEKEQEFEGAVEEKRARTQEFTRQRADHDEIAHRRISEAFTHQLQAARINATILERQDTLGRILLRVDDLQAAQWLVSRAEVGNAEPRTDDLTETALRFGAPTVLANKVRNDGYTGTGVNVGILDTGVRTTHSYLDETVQNHITAGGTTCSSTSVEASHGTLVAGMVNSDHSKQKAPAPDANIYDVLVLDYCGSGTAADFQSGLDYLGNQGVKFAVFSSVLQFVNGGAGDARSLAVDWMSWKWDMLVGTPTGNDYSRVNPPCTAYNTLCVGGTNDQNDNSRKNDVIWHGVVAGQVVGSNFGPTSDDRNKPDLVAPAESLKTTDHDSNTDMRIDTGTSFAAPLAIGVAAQLYDYGAMDRREIKAILIETAQDHQEGIWDGEWGWGYLHAYEAIKLAYAGTTGTASIAHNSLVTLETVTYDVGDLMSGTVTWNRKGATTCCLSAGIADIDLFLYDPNGNVLERSDTSDENVEHISTIATTAGTYTWKALGYNVPTAVGTTIAGYAITNNPGSVQECVDLAPQSWTTQANCQVGPEVDPNDDVPDTPDLELLEYIQYELDRQAGPLPDI